MLGTGSGPAFVDVSAAFTPRGFRLEARSLNPGIATVSAHDDTALRVTPVGAGRTTIEVTASNSFGSGSRQLQVEVVGPPRASGTIRPVSLTIGAPPEVVDLRNAFSPAGSQVTARSLNERVVTVSVGEGSSLTLTPVAAGNTSVEVTARNASGSATLSISVAVAAVPPPTPGTVGHAGTGFPLRRRNRGPGGCRGRLHPCGRPDRGPIPQLRRRKRDGERKRRYPHPGGRRQHLGGGHRAQRERVGDTLSIAVAVAAAAPTAPVAVGTVDPISFSAGGAAVDLNVAAAFTPAGVPIEARSLNTGVVQPRR